jgi:hypothetical protein
LDVKERWTSIGRLSRKRFPAMAVWSPWSGSTPVRCPSEVLGPAATALGRYDEAEAHFATDEVYLNKCGDRPGLAWLKYNRADNVRRKGGTDSDLVASRLEDEALTAAQELGMKPLVQKIIARKKMLKA